MTHDTAAGTAHRRLDGLLTLLERLDALHHELGALLDEKIERMRQSDLTGLQHCIERESALAARINEQEGLRRQLMERIGRGYGIAPQTARSLPARRLAERLAQPHRARIIAAADRLKASVCEVVRRNGFINRVSAQILGHLEEVFAGAAASRTSAGMYTESGKTVKTGRIELFEAIG